VGIALLAMRVSDKSLSSLEHAFQSSANVRFVVVRHLHQSLFLPLSKSFAKTASMAALAFRPSHFSQDLSFRDSTNMRSATAFRSHSCAFHVQLKSFIDTVSAHVASFMRSHSNVALDFPGLPIMLL
jgi:hypothetical protein